MELTIRKGTVWLKKSSENIYHKYLLNSWTLGKMLSTVFLSRKLSMTQLLHEQLEQKLNCLHDVPKHIGKRTPKKTIWPLFLSNSHVLPQQCICLSLTQIEIATTLDFWISSYLSTATPNILSKVSPQIEWAEYVHTNTNTNTYIHQCKYNTFTNIGHGVAIAKISAL